MYLESYENLQGLVFLCLRCMPLGLVIGVFEAMQTIFYKIGCKMKCHTLQGLSKKSHLVHTKIK